MGRERQNGVVERLNLVFETEVEAEKARGLFSKANLPAKVRLLEY